MGADFVATGHYAQVEEQKSIFLNGGDGSASHPKKRYSSALGEDSKHFSREYPASHRHHSKNAYYLRQSPDASKDQSYFLWTLNQEQLSKILFPVGNLKKTEVRKLAKKFTLPVAEKKDSQGICFLGAVDLKDFLKHYIEPKEGKVENEKGEVIGHHDGVVFHTLGERHGFTITKKSPTDGPYYVIKKDLEKNILAVSQNKSVSNPNMRTDYKIEKTNWISLVPEEEKVYTAQIRYHGEFLPCKIICGSKALAEVVFEKGVLVAPGQSIVVYDGDVCLGGGVVVQ